VNWKYEISFDSTVTPQSVGAALRGMAAVLNDPTLFTTFQATISNASGSKHTLSSTGVITRQEKTPDPTSNQLSLPAPIGKNGL
jgi:hypothetical protein